MQNYTYKISCCCQALTKMWSLKLYMISITTWSYHDGVKVLADSEWQDAICDHDIMDMPLWWESTNGNGKQILTTISTGNDKQKPTCISTCGNDKCIFELITMIGTWWFFKAKMEMLSRHYHFNTRWRWIYHVCLWQAKAKDPRSARQGAKVDFPTEIGGVKKTRPRGWFDSWWPWSRSRWRPPSSSLSW